MSLRLDSPAVEHSGAVGATEGEPGWLVRLREMARFNYLKTRWRMGAAMFPPAVIGIGVLVSTMLLLRGALGDDLAAGLGFGAYIAALGVGMPWYYGRLERRRAREIAEVAAEADARAIGPLASMVRGNVIVGAMFVMPTLRAIVVALQRLLDDVGPEDRDVVGESDRAELRSLLQSCANHYGLLQARIFPPSFIASALGALEKLEDRPAVNVAERLTRALGIGSAVREVRSIAGAALPGLRVMAKRVQEREQLLRPADAPTEPDMLLRPAGGAPTGDQAQLVRPAECPQATEDG